MQNEELARLLGYLPDGTPIWQQIGFAPDDGDEGDDEEGDEDDGEDEGDEEDEYVPPTREEFEAMQRKVIRYKKGLAKYRLKEKGRTADDEDELDDDEDDDKGSGKGTDRKELKRLLARAEARAESKWKEATVRNVAKSALVEAGFVGDVSPRVLGWLDLNAIEVDEDGEIVGLEDQIEELKEDMPQLFKRSSRTGSGSSRTTTKTTGRKSLDGGNKRAAKKEPTWAEKLAAQLGQ